MTESLRVANENRLNACGPEGCRQTTTTIFFIYCYYYIILFKKSNLLTYPQNISGINDNDSPPVGVGLPVYDSKIPKNF